VCHDAECVDKALRAGQLAHAFKRPSEWPATGAAGILGKTGGKPVIGREPLEDVEALNFKVRR
jgi:hypothetical protein